ncbi:MAG: hypothetical protein QXM54_00555 [Desulfurococcaceae archaeon]|uniref:Uncharacterized protein n=1 Tax=Staphylothermus marinus TaxID=2280 RepID=A0A7J3KEV3_STAMA
MSNNYVLGWMKNYANILVVYGDGSRDRVGQAISKFINELSISLKIFRFNIFVYTDIERPFFLEDTRIFLQSNLVNSITIWGKPMKQILFDIDVFVKTNPHTFVLIDKEHVDELGFLKEKVNVFRVF